MDEIAKEAQFTRRTLYQYFVNKEDLCFAVIYKGFQQLSSYMEAAVTPDLTGYEKARQAGVAYYRFYQDNPDIFRLMNYIGYIRAKAENSPKFKEFIKFDNTLFENLAKVVEEGQKDGSIRKDLEADKMAYSLVFVLTGFLYELSVSGKTFTKHFSLDEETFVLSTLDLIYQSIRNGV
jgi:AcrR family transcriptional regulator